MNCLEAAGSEETDGGSGESRKPTKTKAKAAPCVVTRKSLPVIATNAVVLPLMLSLIGMKLKVYGATLGE